MKYLITAVLASIAIVLLVIYLKINGKNYESKRIAQANTFLLFISIAWGLTAVYAFVDVYMQSV